MTKRKLQTQLALLLQTTVCCLAFLLSHSEVSFGVTLNSIALKRGYAKIKFVSEFDLSSHTISKEREKKTVETFCSDLAKEFKRYSWSQAPCEGVLWQADLMTDQKHPLLYTTFGEGVNTTLILGGVHPDELTPIHLAFRFARYLQNNPHIYRGKDIRVVIAPLVNPDGFLRKFPTRTNGDFIDLNRNFLTSDWYEEALQNWTRKKASAGRFFPGYFPNSEIETLFQNRLLDRFLPTKVFSIHAPLGFYDYDGPGDKVTSPLTEFEEHAKIFAHKVSEKSKNYRIVDYSVYPGSLGNLTGKHRRVPTLTLELETTNPRLVDEYWNKFLPGFLQSIQFVYKWKPQAQK